MLRHHIVRTALALLLVLPLALVGPRPAHVFGAPSCVITRDGAAGGLDLRDALAYPGCPTITFAPGVAEVTLTTHLDIARNVTVQGPGAAALAIRYTGAVAATGGVIWVHQGT